VGEPLKRSAAEPQPKDDRIGFAACCEDVAVPFRVDALQDLGFALRFEIMPGRSPKSKGALLRKGKAASSQQAAKPLPKSRSEKQESKDLLRRVRRSSVAHVQTASPRLMIP